MENGVIREVESQFGPDVFVFERINHENENFIFRSSCFRFPAECLLAFCDHEFHRAAANAGYVNRHGLPKYYTCDRGKR